MNIKLYINKSDNNVLEKTLDSDFTIKDILLKEDTSVINPHFIVDYFDNYSQYNYLYCADMGRYYYINDISVQSGGLLALQCTVDPLMSYAAQIKNCTIMIDSKTNADKFVNGGQYRLLMPHSTLIKANFSGSEILPTITANNFSYIIQTIGGIRE